MKRTGLLLAFFGCLALYACGRSDLEVDTPLDDQVTPPGSGDDAGTSPDVGVTPPPPGPDASGVIDVSVPIVDATPPSEAGRPPPDSGTPPPVRDAGRPPEAGPDVTPPPVNNASGPIACGATTCNGGTQECCITLGGRGGLPATPTCTPAGQCNTGLALTCASGANCPRGDSCCLGLIGPGASCQPTCGGLGGGGLSVELCNSDAQCPAGETCQAALFGVRLCLPNFGGGGGFGAQ